MCICYHQLKKLVSYVLDIMTLKPLTITAKRMSSVLMSNPHFAASGNILNLSVCAEKSIGCHFQNTIAAILLHVTIKTMLA